MKRLLLGASLLLALTARADVNPDWIAPIPPFRIAGNLYYVGSKGLASYLVTTPGGHILINSDLEADVPLIRDSVAKLGFKIEDVKILLVSHAHDDHVAGSAALKKLTGARYMVMDADVPVVESGGKADFQYPEARYPETKVDRVLHDGDEVNLGDATLVAHKTPGHTRGCTTWTMKVDGLDAVIVGGPGVNRGYKLVGNEAYPTIAEDYERTFRVLEGLHCDLFLGAHGGYFDMEAKLGRMKPGGPNLFVDPEGYKAFVAGKKQDFCAELERQRGASGH